MRVGIIAEKLGMSRFFDKSGTNQPVTLLRVNNCKIIDIRTQEKNGYNALRLSYGSQKKNSNKVKAGFLKKNNISNYKTSREFRVENIDGFKIGDEINVSNFIEGQFIDVSSKSIGKGFAGGMKRHNFGGNRATHGVSISHRSHGSTGQCQDPGKVFKGKKMAGHLGNKKVTSQNLKILKIDQDKNLLIVKGSVPGHKGSIITVFDSTKKKQDINISIDNKNSTHQASSENENQKETSQDNSLGNENESVDKPLSENAVQSQKNSTSQEVDSKVDKSSSEKEDDSKEPKNEK